MPFRGVRDASQYPQKSAITRSNGPIDSNHLLFVYLETEVV